MNKLVGALGALMIIGLLAADIQAQPPGGGRGFGRFNGASKEFLLGRKSIQEELQLDEKQIKQIEKRREKQREFFQELREMEPEAAEKKLTRQAKANDVSLAKLLTPAQFKRLTEISIQQRGPRALADPEVAKAVGLTNAQKNKVQQIQEESDEEARPLRTQLWGMAFAGRGFPGGGFPGGGFPGGGFGGGPPDGGGGRRRGEGTKPPEATPASAAEPKPPTQATTDQPPPALTPNPTGGQEKPGGLPAQLGIGGVRPGDDPEVRKARQEMRKKLDEMRESTNERLLAVLNKRQQSKWEKMQGEPYKGNQDRGENRRGRGPS